MKKLFILLATITVAIASQAELVSRIKVTELPSEAYTNDQGKIAVKFDGKELVLGEIKTVTEEVEIPSLGLGVRVLRDKHEVIELDSDMARLYFTVSLANDRRNRMINANKSNRKSIRPKTKEELNLEEEATVKKVIAVPPEIRIRNLRGEMIKRENSRVKVK